MRLTRRRFVGYMAASALLGGCERRLSKADVRIGLALGGGGARGLAHVVVLEALDELGIRPYRIAGTSIGAVIGALYASGHSGREVRRLVSQLIVEDKDTLSEILFRKHTLKWLEFFDLELGGGGLIDSDGFIRYLGEVLGRGQFGELDIPLQVVAADLWSGEPVVFDRGPLLPAIKASIAIPGIFEPVEHNGRYLVDGGTVNPLPFDLLRGCDLTIAVDVTGELSSPDGAPSYTETLFHSFHNMEKHILELKLRERRPDIYLRPEIRDIRVLEFYRADEIYRQAEAAKAALKRELARRVTL